MRNFSFVLWILGFPLSCSVSRYLDVLASGQNIGPYSEKVAFVVFLIWVIIGFITYEGTEVPQKIK